MIRDQRAVKKNQDGDITFNNSLNYDNRSSQTFRRHNNILQKHSSIDVQRRNISSTDNAIIFCLWFSEKLLFYRFFKSFFWLNFSLLLNEMKNKWKTGNGNDEPEGIKATNFYNEIQWVGKRHYDEAHKQNLNRNTWTKNKTYTVLIGGSSPLKFKLLAWKYLPTLFSAKEFKK